MYCISIDVVSTEVGVQGLKRWQNGGDNGQSGAHGFSPNMRILFD